MKLVWKGYNDRTVDIAESNVVTRTTKLYIGILKTVFGWVRARVAHSTFYKKNR